MELPPFTHCSVREGEETYCLHNQKMSSGVCSFGKAAQCDSNVIYCLKDIANELVE